MFTVRQPVPGELLFEFYRERDHKFFRCELRDHGRYGVETQFFDPIDPVIAPMFQEVKCAKRIIPARDLAIARANGMRKTWPTPPHPTWDNRPNVPLINRTA